MTLLAVAIVALGAFLRHIGRRAEPFIAPRFIHRPGFSTINLFNMLYGGATSGVMALVPLYATDRYGIGVLGSGTLLIAQGGAGRASPAQFSPGPRQAHRFWCATPPEPCSDGRQGNRGSN